MADIVQFPPPRARKPLEWVTFDDDDLIQCGVDVAEGRYLISHLKDWDEAPEWAVQFIPKGKPRDSYGIDADTLEEAQRWAEEDYAERCDDTAGGSES